MIMQCYREYNKKKKKSETQSHVKGSWLLCLSFGCLLGSVVGSGGLWETFFPLYFAGLLTHSS